MEPTRQPPPTRRDFLGKTCVTSGCAACAFAVLPVVDYLIPRPPVMPQGPKDVAGADELPEGGAKRVKVGPVHVLIVRNEGKLTAMNAKCTHFGCLVEWDEQARMVRCYCHGGLFQPDGNRVSGPPQRDLPKLEVKTEEGRVIVIF